MNNKKPYIFAIISALTILGLMNYGVKISATIPVGSGAKLCPVESPIHVTVTNFTFKKIKKVEFTLEFFESNTSRNMLEDSRYILEQVTDKFSTTHSCHTSNLITNLNDSLVNKSKNLNKIDKVITHHNGYARPHPNPQQLIQSHRIHLTDINIFYMNGQKEYQELDYSIEKMKFFTSEGKIPNGCFGQLKTDMNGDNSVAAIFINRPSLRGCIGANYPFPGGEESSVYYKINGAFKNKNHTYRIAVCEEGGGSIGTSCDKIVVQFKNRDYSTPDKLLRVLSLEKVGEW